MGAFLLSAALSAPLLSLTVLPARAETPAVAALQAADAALGRGDLSAAEAAAARGGPVVERIMQWRRLLRDGEGEFLDYAAFMRTNPDWPELDDIQANGETAITAGEDPATVVAFFGDRAPRTGEGAVALARALESLGRGDEARAMLVETWGSLPLTATGQKAMLDAHGALLAPHHWARAEAMLWRWRTAEAERMLPLLDEDQAALTRARVAVIRESGAARALIADLPAALRDDPGLAYDRFNHLAEEGELAEAAAILAARSDSAAELGQPVRWATWRAQVVRWVMREGRHQEAYELASRHFATEGDAYADLEWLAGYLSLRFLGEPERALEHFAASEAAVTGPISLSRAAYWSGRALEELGREAEAAEAYGRGAPFQTAFYGLLSAEKLGLTLDPTLTGAEDFGDWRGSSVLNGSMAQAMLMLLAAGDRAEALDFALQMARTMDRVALGQLARLLEEMHEPHIAVLVGKAAVERGIVVPSAYFPLHPMAREDWPVGTDLALSIARRESEFNPVVSSPVGAQGLMQLMPATAREVSGWLGMPYSQGRLANWEYNAALGTRYLQMLEEMFGSSPVLIAAGYNAGPGRPRQWMSQRGDIRDAHVDVVDWVEHIPFAETRTYVMRVSESIPVYRARLTGEIGPIRFTEILKGEPPLIRPVARAEIRDPSELVPVQRVSTSDISEALAAVPQPPSVRPVARPPTDG